MQHQLAQARSKAGNKQTTGADLLNWGCLEFRLMRGGRGSEFARLMLFWPRSMLAMRGLVKEAGLMEDRWLVGTLHHKKHVKKLHGVWTFATRAAKLRQKKPNGHNRFYLYDMSAVMSGKCSYSVTIL